MRQTLAEQVADAMGNDGQRFESADGRDLSEVCEQYGATAEYGELRTATLTRYVFADGSAIVATPDAWDLEGGEPFSWPDV
jgi:hypothetical protein